MSFFEVDENNKKHFTRVWLGYKETEQGVKVCIYFKNMILTSFHEGDGKDLNIVKALMETLISTAELLKDNIIIYCKNYYFTNVLGEWKKMWIKNNYKTIEGKDRPFAEELRKIDEKNLDIHKVIHIVNTQDWKECIDKELEA